MFSHSKIKFGCFCIFSIISAGLLIQNGLFMLQNRDVSHREKQLTDLNAKIAHSQETQKRLFDEIQELVKNHVAIEEKVSQLRTTAQTLEETKNQNQQLQQSNLQLQSKISEAHNKKNAADLELAKVSIDLNSKNEELRSKETEYLQLKALQDTNKDLKIQKVEHEIQCNSLLAKSKQISEKIAQQQNEQEDLQKSNLKLESSKKEIANLEQKKSLLNQELKDNQTQLNELTIKKNNIQDKLIDQQATLASLQKQSNVLKETILQQQQLAGRLEQLESTLLARRLDLGKLEEEHQNRLSMNADEIKNANQKIFDLKETLSSENQALNVVKTQVKQQQMMLEDLKTTFYVLEAKKNKLTQTESEF